MDEYRERIVASIEKSSGTQVAVRRMQGGWGGLRPTLRLEDLQIVDRKGRSALAIERAEVTLSWWSLFLGQVRFHDVDFHRPALALRRGADGLVYLADKPLNEPGGGDDRFVDWLLEQPKLGIHDATLAWRDELTNSSEIRLTGVDIAVRKHRGRHRAALTASPPRALAQRLDVRLEALLRKADARWTVSGEGYAEVLQGDLGALRAHLPLPEALRSGVGSVRVWARVADSALRELTADARMRDARFQLAADGLPLELASLAGRVNYRGQSHGFQVATEGLRFRLANGTEARPGNLSVSRSAEAGQAPKGEIKADGIDLKIAASLLDYLPVPADVKSAAHRFAPRGRIANASLTWSGESAMSAKAFAIRGRFEDVAVNAVDRAPGVSGLTGSIEGTEAGGSLRLESRNASLELREFFRAPLAIDRLEGHVRWTRTADATEVVLDTIRFANAHAEGQLAGTWKSVPGKPGIIDVRAQLTRADVTKVAHYIPNRLATTRDWLEKAIVAGTSPRATLELRGDLYEFPFAGGKAGRFVVEGDVRDARLKYHPEWPSVDAIHGTVRFENARMEIRGERAAIFGSRVSGATAVIADLGAKPPVLVVQGTVDTSGADSVRFLRESPLVSGPGAFTRVVAIEGPGQLKLRLVYPLWGTEPIQVAGDYQFNGASASVGRNLAMRDVRGELSFSEKGVRAQGLTGTMFGQPTVLRMSTTPEGRVLTLLDGRIEASGLRPHLSEAVAARFSGATEWRARLVSGGDANELVVTSDLKGLAVSLPEPLAKPAGEVRDVAVAFVRLGSDTETVTANAGKGVHARFGKRGERWQAALKFGEPVGAEPQRDGLWLYGSLAAIDADAWQGLFAAKAPAPAAPAAAAGTDLELRGIDVKLGRVRYLGRDFTQVAAALTKTGTAWAGKLEGPMVEGTVRWDPSGRGRVAATLTRLGFGEPAKESADPPPAEAASELPALDVTAERFEFRGRWLGKLEVKAEPVGEEWRIERLNISNPHSQFSSSGGWRKTGAGSITTLALKLEAENLNLLLAQFGYGEHLKRGNGQLEGTLVWPGLPHEFSLGRLAGSLKVEGRRGQFAKIEPGAGKLLGLLSLQSLPRRATFDFRDVFSDGFAFERIHGDVKVARGTLLTENFEISGPSAFVTLAGEVSLPQETQALTMRVVPEVSEGVALAATLIGTPVLGLSTLLVSKLLKNPLGKVVAYEYQVGGSWDNPTVTRTSGPPPTPAAKAPST